MYITVGFGLDRLNRDPEPNPNRLDRFFSFQNRSNPTTYQTDPIRTVRIGSDRFNGFFGSGVHP